MNVKEKLKGNPWGAACKQPHSWTESNIPSPRLFRDERDLEAMQAILETGRQAVNGTYYVHPGDLAWWLFSGASGEDLRSYSYVWDCEGINPGLIGWALFSPRYGTFDVFAHPELRGGSSARQMYVWAEDRCSEIMRQRGRDDLRTMWILETDKVLASHLCDRGFVRHDSMLYMTRSLQDPLPHRQNYLGYHVRNVSGLHEVMQRAEVSHAAFHSEQTFGDYWRHYEKFMRSTVYSPQLDLVCVAPDGQFAAFCICWLDRANQVGLFEPVGTHPAFRRIGLGKAVMLEGMRRMRCYGMLAAQVCVHEWNLPAIRLYESLGFHAENKLITYKKRI